ncbi:MAG: hypothetical protein LT070_02695 [Solirubrobacteraceae bacterium]|nr:hypothetical protein [Solirubrobacteraceae bacterium]
MFTLSAQVFGDQRTVSAEQDALGITVTTSRGPQHARNLNDALRLARDDLGDFLRRGERPGVPWGLCVSVAGVSAYYGDVRFCCSGGGGGGLPSSELVVRIRRRWHDTQGPSAALENALEIIRAYLGRGSERRTA